MRGAEVKGFLLFVVLLVAAVAWAFPRYFSEEARHRREASAFIEKAGMDEIGRDGMVFAYREELKRGRINAEQLTCMEDMSVGEVNEALAIFVTNRVSRRALRTSSEFYDSPLGRKWARSLYLMMKDFSPDPANKDAEPEPQFEMREFKEVEAFRKRLRDSKTPDALQPAVDGFMGNEMDALEKDYRGECGLVKAAGQPG
jgi:hypothetical protein